jgi:hypothetical protein
MAFLCKHKQLETKIFVETELVIGTLEVKQLHSKVIKKEGKRKTKKQEYERERFLPCMDSTFVT